MQTKNFIILKEEAGTRIDILLKKKFENKSRAYFQYLIENKKVLINNKPIKKNKKIAKENDEIKIFFLPLPQIDIKPQNIPLNILFEDAEIIVINKPPNLVVHPGAGNFENTLCNALLNYFPAIKLIGNILRPGIVHRLDKDTSGILIIAKTQNSFEKLTEMFSKREIKKEYLCICVGIPKEGIFSFPIKRDPFKRKTMAIIEDGKEAISKFTIIDIFENFSLIKVFLITGRTHQIRVHLKHLKTPILGDSTYGNKKINNKMKIQRQLLHSYKMSLKHPQTGKILNLKAPLLEDFKKNLYKLNLKLKKM
jgi:23S rRNA pseudouridine1911/1915/1917 synthase